MKITTRKVEPREKQSVSVEGAVEAEPRPYGHGGGRMWLPTRLFVTLERWREPGEDWSQWRVRSASLRGHNHRKDGTAGEERSERWYSIPREGSEREWITPFLESADLPGAVDLDEFDV